MLGSPDGVTAAGGCLKLPMLQEIYRAADIPVYFPLFSSPLGLAYAMSGRVADGQALAEQAVERTESRRQVALLPWTLLRLGEVRLLAGQVAEAGDAAVRALALFREHKEQGGEAYALRLWGEVERRRGLVERAAELVSQARVLASALGMKPLVGRCQRD
jgi:tetratricopeptide (TPR) repeat protein